MRTLLALVAIVALALGASAATVTVSSMSSLQTAISNAASGDVINVASGTYTGSQTITISKSNIVVKAAVPGGAFLNGGITVLIEDSNNVLFSGFQFTSGKSSEILVDVEGGKNVTLSHLNFKGYAAKKYVSLYGQYHTLTNCNFENKPTSAEEGNLVHVEPMGGSTSDYHKIRYNSFQNIPGPGSDYGNECIRVANGIANRSLSRTTIEYNYFTNTGGGDNEAISIKCQHNIIRYNTFKDNQKAMLVFRIGDNSVAYGNYFINAGGIRVKEANNIYCYNNYFQNSGDGTNTDSVSYDYVSPYLKNINFFHNTFINSSPIDLSPESPGGVWANNLFYKPKGDIFKGSPGGMRWSGNMYWGNLGVNVGGMRKVNPKMALKAGGGGWWGLSATSPAINAAGAIPAILNIAGMNDAGLKLDLQGQARHAPRDVGADEYSAGVPVRGPLTKADVGPSYLK